MIRFSAIGLLLLCSGTLAAPITFNSALPVAEDEFVFRQQFRRLRAEDHGTLANRELRATAAVPVLGYGITHRWAVFGVLPYTDKQLEAGAAASRVERDNRGFSDATGFARYTFWRDDVKGRTARLAAFGGLTLPTGNDDEQDRFGQLPPRLQDGTGAWDVFGGVIASWQALGYQFDGQLSYRNNREAGDFEAGDETRLDVSWQHRLWPRQLGDGVPGFLYSVLEINYLHQEQDRLAGTRDRNSGGDIVWISPGLQYVTRRFVVEAIVQKPVARNLNGNAIGNELIVTAGFRFNF